MAIKNLGVLHRTYFPVSVDGVDQWVRIEGVKTEGELTDVVVTRKGVVLKLSSESYSMACSALGEWMWDSGHVWDTPESITWAQCDAE